MKIEVDGPVSLYCIRDDTLRCETFRQICGFIQIRDWLDENKWSRSLSYHKNGFYYELDHKYSGPHIFVIGPVIEGQYSSDYGDMLKQIVKETFDEEKTVTMKQMRELEKFVSQYMLDVPFISNATKSVWVSQNVTSWPHENL